MASPAHEVFDVAPECGSSTNMDFLSGCHVGGVPAFMPDWPVAAEPQHFSPVPVNPDRHQLAADFGRIDLSNFHQFLGHWFSLTNLNLSDVECKRNLWIFSRHHPHPFAGGAPQVRMLLDSVLVRGVLTAGDGAHTGSQNPYPV